MKPVVPRREWRGTTGYRFGCATQTKAATADDADKHGYGVTVI